MSAQPLAWIEREFPQRCIGTNGDVACTRVGTFWAVNAQGGRLGPMCKRHATALVDLTIQLALRAQKASEPEERR
jgi:hypothetical protein